MGVKIKNKNENKKQTSIQAHTWIYFSQHRNYKKKKLENFFHKQLQENTAIQHTTTNILLVNYFLSPVVARRVRSFQRIHTTS